MIACVSRNQGIGYQGDLIVKSAKDMKRFTAKTKNKNIVMGYGTWKSLPTEVLPNRYNHILTHEITREMRDLEKKYEELGGNTKVKFHHLFPETQDTIIEHFSNYKDEVLIIGGQSLYELFIPHAEKMYITYVHADLQADRYFPYFDTKKWNIIEERHVKDRIDFQARKVEMIFYTFHRSKPSKGSMALYPKDLDIIETIKNKTENLLKARSFGNPLYQ